MDRRSMLLGVVACRLDSLDKRAKQRHKELTAKLRAAIVDVREEPDGFRFRLRDEFLRDLSEWITLERKCCSFWRFDVSVEREVELRLSGPPEAKAILAGMVKQARR
ncbi:MAG: hypothetical protein ACRD8O_09605 [Bryobacteraceae bacterium]